MVETLHQVDDLDNKRKGVALNPDCPVDIRLICKKANESKSGRTLRGIVDHRI